MTRPPSNCPVTAILIHVGDVQAGLDWYQIAFPEAKRMYLPEQDFTYLDVRGVALEIVPADEQVASGAAGTVVYWWTDDFTKRLDALIGSGAKLYRGLLIIENKWRMCQVRDPWGNCIGLRGPYTVSVLE